METDCKLQQRGSEAAWLWAGRAGLVRNAKDCSVPREGSDLSGDGRCSGGAVQGRRGECCPGTPPSRLSPAHPLTPGPSPLLGASPGVAASGGLGRLGCRARHTPDPDVATAASAQAGDGAVSLESEERK